MPLRGRVVDVARRDHRQPLPCSQRGQSVVVGVVEGVSVVVEFDGDVVPTESLYQLAELLKGRPLSEELQVLGLLLGIALLVALMGIAFYNDLSRLFG